MARTFGASATDHIDHGTCGGVNATSLTHAAWIYITTFTSSRGIANRIVTAEVDQYYFQLRNTSDVRFIWQRSGASASNYLTNNANLTTNKWWCVAVTFDQSATTGTRAKIYVGDLTTPLAECTYGTATDDGGGYSDLSTGTIAFGSTNNSTFPLQGRMGDVLYTENKVLSAAELRRWQFAPGHYFSEDRIVSRYGAGATEPDWSGHANSGTPTGTSVSGHTPLKPRFGYATTLRYTAAAAPAATVRQLAALGVG